VYKKILVPLDGSELAECSLAHVKAIAAGCNVPEVILLSVHEPLPQDGMGYSQLGDGWQDNFRKSRHDGAQKYLKNIAAELEKTGINITSKIVDGFVADTILDFAKKNNVDLIIMSTHGRSGVVRWAIGSIADRVVRHATVPVLAVASPSCRV
jgi:nucleotide-binding universal stress UspA family protein